MHWLPPLKLASLTAGSGEFIWTPKHLLKTAFRGGSFHCPLQRQDRQGIFWEGFRRLRCLPRLRSVVCGFHVGKCTIHHPPISLMGCVFRSDALVTSEKADLLNFHMSNEKKGCLGYRRDYTPQLYRNSYKPL